jgi:putative tricarboxylic transport membrane protein
MALLIGAFMIHGVIPGPFILEKQPEIFWGIVTSMYVGNVILLILNVPLIKCFVRIMEVPIPWLSPLLIIICTIGSFSINNNPMDILVLYFFGTIGYFMRKFDYEPAPLVLGCVLGQRMEKSIQQSLIMSQGSLSIFFDRPIARILFIAAIIMVFSPLLKNLLKHKGLVPALHRKV